MPSELDELLNEVADQAVRELITSAFVRGMECGRNKGETAAYMQYAAEIDWANERERVQY